MKLLKYLLPAALIIPLTVLSASAQEKKPPTGRLVIEHANYASTNSETRISTLKEEVMLRYYNYEDDTETIIYADEASVDDTTKTTFAKGNVQITQEDMSLSGDTLMYKFNEKYFEITNVSGVTEGDKELKGKMYFSGELAVGTEKKVNVYRSHFSTCGPNCSNEYHMTASKITIFPGKRAIARKTAIYLRHTRVMWLPVYIHSLKEDENYRPTFGYNKTEGFFVKNRYPYLNRSADDPKNPSDLGYVIFNYKEKIGDEYGWDRQYYSRRFGGAGHVVASNNRQKFTGYSNNNVKINQSFSTGKLGGSLAFDRASSYNSYNVNLRRNTINLTSNFKYDQSKSRNLNGAYSFSANRGTSPSENKTITVKRSVRFNKKLNTAYDFEWKVNQSGTLAPNIESALRTTTNYNSKFYGLNVLTYKTFDPDGDSFISDQGTSVSQILLPKVTLSLNNSLWNKRLPILSSINYVHGRYREGSRSNFRMLRSNELVATFTKKYSRGKRFTLTPTHTITQKFYSTKDANYVMDFRAMAKYTIDNSRNLSVNFTRRGNSGGSPYTAELGGEQITLQGRYEMTKFGVTALEPAKKKQTTRFSTGTTYSYKTRTFSTLELLYMRAVTHFSILNVNGGRNLNNNTWNDTKTTLTLSRKNTTLSLNALWDTEKDFDLKTSDFTTEHKRRNGWKIKIRSSYIHKDKHGIVKDIVATKTRCCTELEFLYNTEREEFRFQYIITAFPSKKFGFTQGDQGLELDSGLTEFTSE